MESVRFPRVCLVFRCDSILKRSSGVFLICLFFFSCCGMIAGEDLVFIGLIFGLRGVVVRQEFVPFAFFVQGSS